MEPLFKIWNLDREHRQPQKDVTWLGLANNERLRFGPPKAGGLRTSLTQFPCSGATGRIWTVQKAETETHAAHTLRSLGGALLN